MARHRNRPRRDGVGPDDTALGAGVSGRQRESRQPKMELDVAPGAVDACDAVEVVVFEEISLHEVTVEYEDPEGDAARDLDERRETYKSENNGSWQLGGPPTS